MGSSFVTAVGARRRQVNSQPTANAARASLAARLNSYSSLMDQEQAAIVFTDPPYNVTIDGHASGLGSVRHREFAMACGEMGEGEFTEFLTRACNLATQHSHEGAIHFVCMDWRATPGSYSRLASESIPNSRTSACG